MKIPYLLTLALIITVACFFSSCKKDSSTGKQLFEVTLQTWYRVSPTVPTPVVVNDTSYVSIANLVVGGTGTCNVMGDVKNYANTLSYSIAADSPATKAISAPVKEIPTYAVVGGPLPLLQTGDFADASKIISSLNVPESINGHIVSLVLYSNNNDAIFMSGIQGSGTSIPISDTVGGYTNKDLIVGGIGKFRNATGEVDNDGHFSFVEPYDGVDHYKGWISY